MLSCLNLYFTQFPYKSLDVFCLDHNLLERLFHIPVLLFVCLNMRMYTCVRGLVHSWKHACPCERDGERERAWFCGPLL